MEFTLTSHPYNPAILICSNIIGEEDEFQFPPIYTTPTKWGDSIITYLLNAKFQYPKEIQLLFYSPLKCSFYTLKAEVAITVTHDFLDFMLGISGNGTVILYGSNNTKRIELKRWEAISDISLNNDIRILDYYKRQYPNKNFISTLSTFNLYSYRFVIDIHKPENYIKNIKISFCDSTYNKALEELYTFYTPKTLPIKLSIEYSIVNDLFSINIFFKQDLIELIFYKFYGAHLDTKTDFIIKIDAEKKIYELALYRQGLKEPVVIPESAYQLIVFKNKFEDYRSENYNQPRGAWIW